MIHTASVVEIIEVAQMDMALAAANLHHPFAVPPIPSDAGRAGPVGLGHGYTSMLHGKGRGSGSAALRVDWPVYPRRVEHNTVAEGEIDELSTDGPSA
jgi:hypothetical protein